MSQRRQPRSRRRKPAPLDALPESRNALYSTGDHIDPQWPVDHASPLDQSRISMSTVDPAPSHHHDNGEYTSIPSASHEHHCFPGRSLSINPDENDDQGVLSPDLRLGKEVQQGQFVDLLMYSAMKYSQNRFAKIDPEVMDSNESNPPRSHPPRAVSTNALNPPDPEKEISPVVSFRDSS
jgi:hypothetical protein